MKCGRCEAILSGRGLVVTVVGVTQVATANLCIGCMDELVEARGRRKLEAAVFACAWVQDRLPLPEL